MTSETVELGEFPEDDDHTERARLQQRTWLAAVPYLAGAVVAWIGAGLAEYQLRNALVALDQPDQDALRQTVLQVLSQALLYVGLSLFLVGLLVAALRQHERWRRDSGPWPDERQDLDDSAVG